MRIVNQLNEWIGRTVSWLTLGVVLVCFSVVVLRYVFNIGFVWMQDIYVWLHAIAFTLGAGYALLHDHHVRVDIFYRPASERYKAWLNLLGVLLLLLPFVTILVYWGWGYVVRSWMLQERSQNVGGMHGLYVIKSCLIAFAVLVGLQGLSIAARSILILTGNKTLLSPRDLPRLPKTWKGPDPVDSILIGEALSVAMFFGVVAVLMLGFPVAFTLAGTSLIFAGIGWHFDAFNPALFGTLVSRYVGAMVNEVLVAVPLFVFMGVMLERSRIAEQLLVTMAQLFGSLRGGLGLSVIMVGALLAASTGIVGATVVTMGLLSLPAMLRAGYDPKLACGIICASGTLGQIIPPSTVLIFMGDILQGANAQAQMALGNFAPNPVSVGDLFVGAFIPGFILVGLYMGWTILVAIFRPQAAPALEMSAEERRDLPKNVAVALVPALALIVAVLGSILAGIATPTEFGFGRCRRSHAAVPPSGGSSATRSCAMS